MLKLQFNLRHQDICLVNRGAVVATDSKNYLVAQFNQLTDDWETPVTAIFTDDKHQQPYAVIVDPQHVPYYEGPWRKVGGGYTLTEQDKQDIADIVIQRLQGGD